VDVGFGRTSLTKIVSPLSSVIVQVRLGRSDRRFAAWRLASGSFPRRANFLQLVSRAMVRLDLEALRKITWRFEGYASTRRRATYGRCGADTTKV
jgi:hypothetical protein